LDVDQANDLIEKSRVAENKYRMAVMDKDMELHLMAVSMEEMKITYERILADSLKSMKNRFVESLPGVVTKTRNMKHLKYFDGADMFETSAEGSMNGGDHQV
jgi:hypothetical protein